MNEVNNNNTGKANNMEKTKSHLVRKDVKLVLDKFFSANGFNDL